jgi:replicative DNA helicase
MINNKNPEYFEIEKIILLSAINSKLTKNKVLLSLTSDDFFITKNKIIFEYNSNNKNKKNGYLSSVSELKEKKI